MLLTSMWSTVSGDHPQINCHRWYISFLYQVPCVCLFHHNGILSKEGIPTKDHPPRLRREKYYTPILTYPWDLAVGKDHPLLTQGKVSYLTIILWHNILFVKNYLPLDPNFPAPLSEGMDCRDFNGSSSTSTIGTYSNAS